MTEKEVTISLTKEETEQAIREIRLNLDHWIYDGCADEYEDDIDIFLMLLEKLGAPEKDIQTYRKDCQTIIENGEL